MTLEERLATHLHERFDPNRTHAGETEANEVDENETDADHIGTVRSLAKRRTLRTRAAVATCGLAALVGASSFIPTATTDSNALTTANEPADVTDSTDPDALPEPAQATNEPKFEVDLQTIVNHRDGGFVAIDGTTSGPVHFVHSRDGLTWTQGPTWSLDERDYVQRLQRSDDQYVAVVTRATTSADQDPLQLPRIAVSADLTNWTTSEIAIDNPLIPGLRIRSAVLSSVVLGDQLMIQTMTDVEVVYAEFDLTSDDVCGRSESLDGLWLHRCEGTSVQVADASEAALLALHRPARYFVGTAGQTLVEVDPPAVGPGSARLFVHLDRIAAINESGTTGVSLDQQGEWVPLKLVDESPVIAIGSSAEAEEALLASWSSAPNNEHHLRVDLRSQRVSTSRLLPLDPLAGGEQVQIGDGPAGWAVLVTPDPRVRSQARGGTVPWMIESNGWLVYPLDEDIITLELPDRSVRYQYRGDQGPHRTPNVEFGFFTSLRFLRPGTEETLVELTGLELFEAFEQQPEYAPAWDHVFAPREMKADGWTLNGNIMVGPISVLRPDGSQFEITNGFDFENGDLSDGVEANLSPNRDSGTITFANADGTSGLTVGFEQLSEALGPTQPPIMADDVEPFARKALLAFSSDGVTWRHIWTDATARDLIGAGVVVGDDEILLLPLGADEPIRVPLDG